MIQLQDTFHLLLFVLYNGYAPLIYIKENTKA